MFCSVSFGQYTTQGLLPTNKLHYYKRQRRNVRILVIWRKRGKRLSTLQLCEACRDTHSKAGVEISIKPLWEGRIPSGHIAVTQIEESDQGAAMVVLTRAFADCPNSPAYKSVMEYVQSFAAKPSEVLLAAYLTPDDPAKLPPMRQRRVVGVTAVNFEPQGKDTRGFSQPVPQPAGYISSMAVDKSFRRQGVAKALLRGAEEVARVAGLRYLYLTALLNDEAAQDLYRGMGYDEVERQRAGAIAFLNITRTVLKVLMCKCIQPSTVDDVTNSQEEEGSPLHLP
eukprot:jgi/Botrbrau1/15634/Bobra.4_1s0019.1